MIVEPRACAWCGEPIPAKRRSDSVFCGRKCRQSGNRLRRRRATDARFALPMRFAYADPPYPRRAWKYKGQPTYAGEVDHAALIARLVAGWPDGWALSTSMDALREVLPLCPRGVHVCPWVKPNGVPRTDRGLSNRWEALLVVGGRQEPPGVRDWLSAKPARGGGDLVGRKPLAFCAFLFDALGMVPGDELDDLFPGSRIVSRAWAELSRSSPGDASPLEELDASQTGEPSPTVGRYGCSVPLLDLSRWCA